VLQFAGLYAGNSKRETKRPTTEAILKAFQNLNLVIVPQQTFLTPLSELQLRLLELLGFPETIYTKMMENPFLEPFQK